MVWPHAGLLQHELGLFGRDGPVFELDLEELAGGLVARLAELEVVLHQIASHPLKDLKTWIGHAVGLQAPVSIQSARAPSRVSHTACAGVAKDVRNGPKKCRKVRKVAVRLTRGTASGLSPARLSAARLPSSA